MSATPMRRKTVSGWSRGRQTSPDQARLMFCSNARAGTSSVNRLTDRPYWRLEVAFAAGWTDAWGAWREDPGDRSWGRVWHRVPTRPPLMKLAQGGVSGATESDGRLYPCPPLMS